MAICKMDSGIWGNWEYAKIKGEDGTSITPKGTLEFASDLWYVFHDDPTSHLGECYFIKNGVLRTQADGPYTVGNTTYPNSYYPENDSTKT